MNLYRNPNLIVSKIDDDFYALINPFIKNGMKVINKNQMAILSLIDGKKDLQQIVNLTKLSQKDILVVCNILKEKKIVNFTNDFPDPIWNKNTKSLNLWIHTTNDCNLRCSYCYIHTLGLKDYITEESIRTLCNKLVETSKKRQLENISLRLAGGEPLIKFHLWKPYLVELKQRLLEISCKLQINILSNLVVLNEEIISFIKENHIGLGVSLDGIKEFQDKTRHFQNGKGSFSLVEKHIMQLKKNDITPGIMTVVSNANLEGLESLTQFVIDNTLYSRFSFVQGEELDIPKLIQTLKKCYDRFEEAIEQGFPFSQLHKLCDLKLNSPFFQTCSNGFNGGALYTDGSFYFCQKKFGIDEPHGSLFEDNDLISIVQRKTYYRNVSSECERCNLRYICTSGCPLERRDGKDPHCEVYKEIVPIIFRLRGKERLRELKKIYDNQ